VRGWSDLGNGFNYRSRIFLVLWTVNFLFSFSTNLIPTPRAYLTSAFLGGDQEATIEALGIMMSLGFAASTIGYFAGGFAAETLGKRRVVIASFAVLAVGCGIFAAAPSLYYLYLANFVEFFAAGFSSPAISALVADCSEQESRGMAYGVFNLSWVSPGIAAPLLAGFVAQYVNLQAPFVIALFVCIAGLFLAFLMRGKTTEKPSANEENGGKNEKPVSNGNPALRRVIIIFSITNLLNGLLNGFINPVLNGMLMFKLQAAPAEYGLVLSLSSGLITGLVQIPGGRLTDKFGRKPLVLFSFFGAPLAVLMGFSRSLLDFSLVMGGISAVGNISSPAVSAWLMDLVPERRRASVSGVTQTLNGVGLTAGPNAGSYVWNSTKPDAAVSCGIAAVIFAAGLPFYLMLKEPKKEPSQPRVSP
jgi:MFS family permease